MKCKVEARWKSRDRDEPIKIPEATFAFVTADSGVCPWPIHLNACRDHIPQAIVQEP